MAIPHFKARSLVEGLHQEKKKKKDLDLNPGISKSCYNLSFLAVNIFAGKKKKGSAKCF